MTKFRKDIVKNLVKKLNLNENDLKLSWNKKSFSTRFFYLDNILPKNIINDIYKDIIKNKEFFFHQKSYREDKLTLPNIKIFSDLTKEFIYSLYSPSFVKQVSNIVGIKNLQVDKSFYAGGISIMNKNNFLLPHIDNSHDMTRKRYRRLNLLFYLSPGWKPHFGGNLELWNKAVTKKHTICALQNRIVVMETNHNSYHSVSKVAVEDPRLCISVYFYTNESPNKKNYFHVTSFIPEDKKIFKRIIYKIDTLLRYFVGKNFKMGRGKKLLNKNKH